MPPILWRSWCIDKTGGNPFFAIQFFKALADEGRLSD
jgi:predicted ATPase